MGALGEFRAQWPQYDDLADDALADALHQKYYSDLPKEAVYGKLGVPLAKAAAPAPTEQLTIEPLPESSIEQPARMTLSRGGQPAVANPIEYPTVTSTGVMALEPQNPPAAPPKTLIEQRGAPVTAETFQAEAQRQASGTPEQAAAAREQPGYKGSVAKSATRVLEQGAREQFRTKELVRAGAAPQTAENIVGTESTFGVEPKAPQLVDQQQGTDYIPAQTEEDQARKEWWSKRSSGVRGITKGVLNIASQSQGLADAVYEAMGMPSPSAKRNYGALKGFQDSIIGAASADGGRHLEGILESTITQVPWLALGIARGAATIPLLAMGLGQFGDTYSEARAAGVDVNTARIKGGIFGAAEVLGEMVSLPFLIAGWKEALKGIPPEHLKARGIEFLAGLLAREIPGELGTTTAEFIADKWGPGALHPGWTERDYAQQIVDTIIQTAGQVGLMGAAQSAAGGFLGKRSPGDQIGRALFEDVSAARPGPGAAEAEAIRRLTLDPARAAAARATVDRLEAQAALKGGAPVAPPGGPVPGTAGDLKRAMGEPGKPLAETRQEDAAAALTQAQSEEAAAEAERLRIETEVEAQFAREEAEAAGPAIEQPPTIVAPEGDGTPASPIIAATPEDVAAAAAETNPDPTPAQIEAENFKKGRFQFADPLKAKLGVIAIETAKGGTRTAKDGSWSVPNFPATYGHLPTAMGNDGDKADIFIGDAIDSPVAFVIDQVNLPDRSYDETKSFVGFPTKEAAIDAYARGFSDGKGMERIGAITEMPIAQFVNRARADNLKKAVAYVKQKGEQNAVPVTKTATQERPVNETGAPGAAQPAAEEGANRPRAGDQPDLRPAEGQEPAVSAEALTPADERRLKALREDERKLIQGMPVAEDMAMNDKGASLRKLEAMIEENRRLQRELTAPKGARPATGGEKIGTNAQGQDIFEDARGVRSIVQGGVRISQTVEMVPTRAPNGGVEYRVRPTGEDARFVPVEQNKAERWEGYSVAPAAQDGWFDVRDGDQSLARFQVRNNRPNRIEHYFESPSTRGPVEKAINRFVEQLVPKKGKPSFKIEGDMVPPEVRGEQPALSSLAGLSNIQLDKMAVEGSRNERQLAAEERERRRRAPVEFTVQPLRPGAAPETKTIPAEQTRVERAAETRMDIRGALLDAEAERQADADIAAALGELGDLLGKSTRLNITPEQEQKLFPILTKLFDAAFRKGYIKFKQAARFVRETIVKALGQGVADQLTLDHYQGAYISMAGRYRDKGAENPAAVAAVQSLEEQEDDELQLQPAKPGEPSAPALEGIPADEVSRPEGGRPARGGAPSGGRPDATGDGVRPSGGVQPTGGVGTGTGAVAPATGGTRPAAGEKPAQPGIRGPGRTEPPPGRAGTGGLKPGEIVPVPAGNFVITDEIELGKGGPVQKYQDNVAAIKLLKAIEDDGRKATPDEQKILARYVGWGGLKQAFPRPGAEPAKGWEKRVAEIRELLTPEEYEAAASSIQNAHFTSKAIVDGIWGIARRLGFNGGRVSEFSMGSGNFFGLMPAELRGETALTGVERDSITARIAKQLYPKANILGPLSFEDARFAENTFNLNVGNPPFGNESPYDETARHLKGFSIHNFFFAKAIDKLAPGGLHIQVVSRYLMDAQDSTAREYLAHRTRLVGAIRLPWTAFYENARTEVVTDIVVLQKLPQDEWGTADRSWTRTGMVPDPLGGESMRVNEYFVEHPEMILGTMNRSGEQMHENDITVQPDESAPLVLQIAKAAMNLPTDIYTRGKTEKTIEAEQDAAVAPADVIERYNIGAYFVDGAKLFQRVAAADGSAQAEVITASSVWKSHEGEKTKEGAPKPDTEWGVDRIARVRGMIRIRDAETALLKAEREDASLAEIDVLRQKLNRVYDAYVKQYGFLNEQTNELAFRSDPDAPKLLALEDKFDRGVTPHRAKTLGAPPRKPSATKGVIFSQRVVDPYSVPTKADSAADGLAISIAEKGVVSIPYITNLTGKPETDIIAELTKGDKPAIYLDPETEKYEPAAAYLSGNVKRKYAEARKAGLFDQAEHLKAVFPPDVKAGDIRARAGAPWIDSDVYAAFVNHLLGEDAEAEIKFIPTTGGFAVNIRGGDPVMIETKWGTTFIDELGASHKSRNAIDLIGRILNNKDLTVYHTDNEGNRFTIKEESLALADKAAEIKNEFEEWVFKDADRREKLVAFYNDNLNTNTKEEFDGSYLNLPGKVPDAVIRMRRHQLNAIARIIRRGKVLLDHIVGSGKTYTIAAAIMEMRRLGLVRKPMLVVPNHLVEQWATEFYRLYPGARVLAMRKTDFAKKNRQRMLARVATGDWDAVIFAHSSFGFIENDREVLREAIQSQIADIQAAIDAARETEGKKSRTAAQYQKQKDKLNARLKSLLDKPKDKVFTFQELGVDFVTVDESQEFKNLFFTTQRRGTGGFGNPTGSKKAFDLFIKSRWLQKTQNGRGVVFASGTPVSNSLTELFTLQRYLNLEQLEATGMTSLDAWLASFGMIETEYESNVAGTAYKRKERLRRITNAPEILQHYHDFTDSVTQEQVNQNYREDNDGKEFPIPKVKGGKPRANIVAPRSDAQAAYSAELQERLDHLPSDPRIDNTLKILTDGRKAALDMRLIDPTLPDHPGSKVHIAADNIARIYTENTHRLGTQLVFLDLSTPTKHGKKDAARYLKVARDLLDEPNAAPFGDLRAQWAELRRALEDRLNTMDDQATEDEKGIEAIEKFLEDRDDIESSVTTADLNFSVYDDLRQKLIDRGIPAGEIAFIHDWNGDQRKQDLFDMVNAGTIRVLLGSTAKMGAGTNVQRKAVSLHHLDVPWRPSDIEQREGRVVRQGNEFRMANEDFEVEINAYATEGTSDVFFWQTQEQKLIAINSLRNFKGEREIENVSADSMSAAEMKALASGNPLILEDVKLTEAIRKLEGQRRRHMASEQDMQSEVARYERYITQLPEVIERQAAVVAKMDAYEADPFAGAERPTIEVDGKAMNATEARERIREIAAAAQAKADEANAPLTERRRQLQTEAASVLPGSEQYKALEAQYAEIEKKLERPKFSLKIGDKEYTSADGARKAVIDQAGDTEAFRMVIDGKDFIRRSDVANYLGDLSEEVDFNKPPAKLGTIGGMNVTLQPISRRFGTGIEISIGGETYFIEQQISRETKGDLLSGKPVPITGERIVSAITRVFNETRSELASNRKALDQAQKGLEPLKAQVGKPWGKDLELDSKRARLAEVRGLLAGVSGKAAESAPAARPADATEPDGIEQYKVSSRFKAIDMGASGEISAEASAARDIDLDEKLSTAAVFSDRYLENAAAITEGVIALAKQIAPQVNTEVVGRIFDAEKGRDVEYAGLRRASENLIYISLRHENPERTMRHEAVHSFFDMGLLSGAEKRVLKAKAKEWRKKYGIDARYKNLAGDEVALDEEGMADAYGAHRGGEQFGGFIGSAFAKISRFLRRLGNLLRGMGFKTFEDVFARMESGEVGRRPVKTAKAPAGEKLSVPEAPPAAKETITTRVHGVEDVVLDRERMTPERTQGSIEHAKRIFDEVGLDVVPRGDGLWDVANKGADQDEAGYRLLDALRREVRNQNAGPESPEIASLLTSVAEYVSAGDNTGMSAPLRIKLYGVAQGERSHRGLLLGALAQVSPDSLNRLARNIEGALERVYAEQFGGSGWGPGRDNGTGAIEGTQAVLDDILQRFREQFTDEDLAKIAEASPELLKLIDRLAAQPALKDIGGRLYRKVQFLFKEKEAKSIETLAEDARVNEAAQKIIEDLKQFGIEQKEQPGKKALTAIERLMLMVNPETSEAIDQRIAQAIVEAERNAGIAASLKDAAPDERDLMREAFRKGFEPSWEMVEQGMRTDEYRHWRVLRDNLLGYSPTTLKLVQQVVQGTFKGTKFGQKAPKPVDLRIDINKLARSPAKEVQRVLNVAMQAIEAEMLLAEATPETLLRVSAMIQGQVTAQLEAARARVRDQAFAAPAAKPGQPLTAEQRLRELFNAGLLKDQRLDGAVAAIAKKSAVRRLMPNLSEMVKKVFATRFYRQSELENRFGRALSFTFGLSEPERKNAEKLFAKAYADQFTKAKAKALETVHKSLTPKQQTTVRKVRKLWETIERAVNAGAFDSAWIMKEVALSRGWVVPTDAQLAEIRDLSNREQELRELTDGERATAERDGNVVEAEQEKAAATITERARLKREMQALWLRWTAPLGWKTAEGRRNVARAVNEITSANLLLRPGFFARQLVDVATQTAIYTPTRAVGEAILRYRQDKVVKGRETRLWRDVGEALKDAYGQRTKALRAALASVRRGLAGRSETKNVEQILDNISIFDRAELKADELAKEGKTAQAFLMRMANYFAFSFRYAKALDELQGVLAEAQEMQARVITELREHGATPEEARERSAWVMGDVNAEFQLALARTRQMFDAAGMESTPAKLEQSAWDVVKARQYGRIAAIKLDAEDFKGQNRVLRNVIGWNEREIGGFGGVIAGFGRSITEFAEQIGLPMPLARFSNAIGISINRVLTFTPLGFFQQAFKGSPWYEGERNATQRKIEAAAGTSVGLMMLMLVAAGVLVPRFKWPDDEAEREIWRKLGRQPGTVEVMIGGGKYITVSLTVGPLSFVRPYLVFMGSIMESLAKHEKKAEKLARKAEEAGLQPAMAEKKQMDILYAAALAGYSTFLGGRTAVGIISNLTDYRAPQPGRTAAGLVSPLIPGASQWQELSRMQGVQLDAKRASVLDFMFPTAGTASEKRNFFYDPLNDQTTERIVKVMTGGTWPLATLPIHKDTEKAYRVLYETGWRPPGVQNQPREIGDQFRTFDQDELEKYRELRGRYLKKGVADADLAGLTENEKLEELDAVAQEANQDAIDDVIDMIETRTRGSGASQKVPALKVRPAGPREIRP